MRIIFKKPVLSGKHLIRTAVSVAFPAVCLFGVSGGGAPVLASSPPAAQTRYAPAASDVVLSTSVHAVDAGAASLRALDQAWRRNPQDQAAALAYARAVFLIGLTEGDLRWYGSAKAALQPWWTATALPADGHFLRGLVKQGFHDFAGGLADIGQAIALDEARAEFWSWRFALHLLISNMDAARQDCATMGRLFGADELAVCQAILQYRTGQAAPSAARFKQFGHDLKAGLALATTNWRDQQEPADAVLLLQAALLTDQPKAGAAVLDWMRKTGYTEPALASLAQRIQAHPQWKGGAK